MRYAVPKSEARKIVEAQRNELGHFYFREKSRIIIERLIRLEDFVYAKRIFAYISGNKKDVNTREIINHSLGSGKSVFLPKHYSSTKTLRRFPFLSYDDLVLNNTAGYWEPKIGIDEDMSDIDLIIVPCVAVSMFGQRVGTGAGYYNRLLKKTYAPKYVLAFEFQLFRDIEYEHYDIRVDKIITERRVINTRNF